MNKYIKVLVLIILTQSIIAQRTVMSLNGQADFEQTIDAFPPDEFTRKIPIPGLIDLARPKIDQYEQYFDGTFTSRYNWYRLEVDVPKNLKGQFATLRMLKSKFNTQIFCNGKDMGTYMQCNTPIETDLTTVLNYGEKNILLIRIGDRHMLPKEAATGFDREKFTDIPGIWDDVSIIFSGPIQINRVLALPDYANKKMIAKVRLENRLMLVERNTEFSIIDYNFSVQVKEKKSGKYVSEKISIDAQMKGQAVKVHEVSIDITDPHAWSPNDPFLYELEVKTNPIGMLFQDYGSLDSKDPKIAYDWVGDKDKTNTTFGMRDFKSNGNHFVLNGERITLLGSTITLNRFFEDRDRAALPWDREWVKNLMINVPKSMNWNFMRVSIGLLPSFWYDMADEYGIVIQNEYPMWNLRGRDVQFQQEYTDWVWTDGNHPSIVMWDALNEQNQDYIGNKLIPELKKLDPTRIWDAGWTKLNDKEVDEIHWYPIAHGWWWSDKQCSDHQDKFRFGGLFDKYFAMEWFDNAHTPIILNEYGWLWQDRNGLRSGIRTRGNFDDKDQLPTRINYESYNPHGKQLYGNRDIYDKFVGKNQSAEERWQFQAYMMGVEGEILRATRKVAGLASFALITNNRGYTGDWFKEPIHKLLPTPALLAQYHTHQGFAAFIDFQDGRYLKNPKTYKVKDAMQLSVFVVNDLAIEKTGVLSLSIVDAEGNETKLSERDVKVAPFWQSSEEFSITLPTLKGGYMLLSKLKTDVGMEQISRRYIRIGNDKTMKFHNYKYEVPANYPK